MKPRHVLLLLVGLVASLSGCARRPSYVLDDEEMEHILLDIHRSEGMLDVLRDQYDTPESQRDVMAAVLLRNGVTRQQYDTSLVWYSQHLRRFIRIYLRVNDTLLAEQQRWADIVSAASVYPPTEAGDSVNVWQLPPYVVLNRAAHADKWRWVLPADSNYWVGDSLVWTLRLRQLPPRSLLVAAMGIQFDDGRTGGHTLALRADTLVTVGLRADTAQRIERTILSLQLLPVDPAAPQAVMPAAFVDSISVVRLHR